MCLNVDYQLINLRVFARKPNTAPALGEDYKFSNGFV